MLEWHLAVAQSLSFLGTPANQKKTKPKITIPPYFSSLIEKNGVRLGMCFVVDVSAIFCILIVRCYGFFASKPNVSCFLHAKISLSIDILSEHFVYFLFVLSSWRIGLKLAWLWLVACIFLFFWHVRVFVHTSLYIADRPSKVITIIDPKINVGTCIFLKISFQFPWSIFFFSLNCHETFVFGKHNLKI